MEILSIIEHLSPKYSLVYILDVLTFNTQIFIKLFNYYKKRIKTYKYSFTIIKQNVVRKYNKLMNFCYKNILIILTESANTILINIGCIY